MGDKRAPNWFVGVLAGMAAIFALNWDYMIAIGMIPATPVSIALAVVLDALAAGCVVLFGRRLLGYPTP